MEIHQKVTVKMPTSSACSAVTSPTATASAICRAARAVSSSAPPNTISRARKVAPQGRPRVRTCARTVRRKFWVGMSSGTPAGVDGYGAGEAAG